MCKAGGLWRTQRIPSVGFGLAAMRVRSTQLAWGAVFWRQKAPERQFRRPVQTTGGEKLNHERLDQRRRKELASESSGRRCRIAKVCSGSVLGASAFVRGNSNGDEPGSRPFRESVASRETAHTCADRTVTRSSNVTLDSKVDTNAGITVASGSWHFRRPDLSSGICLRLQAV